MIIAEMCQNHQGKLSLLKMMVKSAAACGAQAAKIQTFFADDLAENWKHSDYDRVKAGELNWNDHEAFVRCCTDNNLIPITSVYSDKYADILWQLGFRVIKVGSANSHDKHLVDGFGMYGFRVIFSTGGQPLASFKFHSGWGALHCVSKYPHSYSEANINRMVKMRGVLPPRTKIGFSDHSDPTEEGQLASKIALLMGAEIIEKHFTIQPTVKTKDLCVSIKPEQLKELCEFQELEYHDKVRELPEWIGCFASKKTFAEKELIERYRERWQNI